MLTGILVRQYVLDEGGECVYGTWLHSGAHETPMVFVRLV
jgi:hypothetical protein